MARPAPIRVGTSGYVYPHWKGVFYPAGLPARQWLPFYAGQFDTVELNNTFYRLPTEKAAKGWADAAPKGFLFAVKGSRYLTHVKRLKDTAQGLRRFFEGIGPLASKVGPVLWQLPPQLKPDLGRLRDFLQALPQGQGFVHVVEPRHPGWYAKGVYQLLDDLDAGLCLHDLLEEAREPPAELPAGVYYRRFHGASARYSGRYGSQALAPRAAEMSAFARSGVPCFAYFNNDAFGHAVSDARDLLRLLGRPTGGLGEVESHPPSAV